MAPLPLRPKWLTASEFELLEIESGTYPAGAATGILA
jgi:hypothetical protein